MQLNSDKNLYWKQKAIKKKKRTQTLVRCQMENGALKAASYNVRNKVKPH